MLMKTRLRFFSALLPLVLIATPLYAATPKAGAKCSKAGAISTYAGKKYTCVKSGKKLVWNKGVKVAAAKPVATPSPSPTLNQPAQLGGTCSTEGSTETLGAGTIRCTKGKWEPSNSSTGSTSGASMLKVSTVWGQIGLLISGNGLGNVADASLVQLPNGNIRIYFKNGNDTQAGIKGFDNYIHSALSTDGGITWSVESGVRIPIQSPVEVLPKAGGGFSAWGWTLSGGKDVMYYAESTDGLTFIQVSVAGLDVSTCKTTSGQVLAPLGDPTIVKLADGTWLLHAQGFGVGNTGPNFARWACVATSPDGKTWTAVQSRSYGGTIDVASNPNIYINKSGKVEWLWSGKDAIYAREGDGTTYGAVVNFPKAGDPERLDLADGTELIALGQFDPRIGGAIVIAKKVTTSYTVVHQSSPPVHGNPSASNVWLVTGTTANQISVMNFCMNKNVKDLPGGSVTIETSGASLKVTAIDPANRGCAFILVGKEKIIGNNS